MARTAIGTRHKYIPGIHGWSAIVSTNYIGEVAEMTIE
jgi:hypothetical protein